MKKEFNQPRAVQAQKAIDADMKQFMHQGQNILLAQKRVGESMLHFIDITLDEDGYLSKKMLTLSPLIAKPIDALTDEEKEELFAHESNYLFFINKNGFIPFEESSVYKEISTLVAFDGDSLIHKMKKNKKNLPEIQKKTYEASIKATENIAHLQKEQIKNLFDTLGERYKRLQQEHKPLIMSENFMALFKQCHAIRHEKYVTETKAYIENHVGGPTQTEIKRKRLYLNKPPSKS